jgi:hypothetical protein
MTKTRSRDSRRQLFKWLEILSLQSQYLFSLLLFVVRNKVLYTTNQEIHNINTRSNINLQLPVCNLTVFQNGAYFSGIKLFNHLPPKIKSLSNEIKLFKPALKGFLTHTHFIPLRSISSIATINSHGFWIINNGFCICNCIGHNYVFYTWNIFDINCCQAATRMIIIFLIYDNELFCAKYIYKYNNFYILTVIVT